MTPWSLPTGFSACRMITILETVGVFVAIRSPLGFGIADHLVAGLEQPGALDQVAAGDHGALLRLGHAARTSCLLYGLNRPAEQLAAVIVKRRPAPSPLGDERRRPRLDEVERIVI